jgi:hypothetical protein
MPGQDDLFVDRTPRHRRVTRWTRRKALPAIGRQGARMAVPVVVTTVMFGGFLVSARSGGAPVDQAAPATPTSLGAVQPIDYKEECLSEGCDNEEIRELWDSYQSECGDEDCWVEEVFELSGGPRYVLQPENNAEFNAMFKAFRDKLHKNTTYKMKAGYTDDAWDQFVRLVDGIVIKTPKFSCEPAC